MVLQTYKAGDGVQELLRKLLQNDVPIGAALDAIAAGTGGTPATAVSTGANMVCATAGTAVQGPTVTATRGVLVVARASNAGLIYIGGSDVTKGNGAKQGVILSPLGMPSQFFPVSNANLLYINADNNNDAAGVIVI